MIYLFFIIGFLFFIMATSAILFVRHRKKKDLVNAGSISGRVTDISGDGVFGAQVIAIDAQNRVFGPVATDVKGNYIISNLPPGIYMVEVHNENYLPARNINIIAGSSILGIDFSLNVVKDFIDRLDDLRFSIETPIGIDEANEAISLFHVVNIMLAGLSHYRIGEEEKIDMLGILKLYYGLQDKSLVNILTFNNTDQLWKTIENDLKFLGTRFCQLQSDLDFLNQEAKRQFNLGANSYVAGNGNFPALFKRYVEIGADPIISIDIRKEEENKFFDKAKLAHADDLLRDLKGIILQLVRSLSKYGTIATKRVNEDWAYFEARSLEVLAIVAQERISDDLNDKSIWSVLAALNGKNRDKDIAPHVVLAKHGGKLFKYAMDIYLETRDKLDNFERDYLRDLFQPHEKAFWTDLIRKEANVIKMYPLVNWE